MRLFSLLTFKNPPRKQDQERAERLLSGQRGRGTISSDLACSRLFAELEPQLQLAWARSEWANTVHRTDSNLATAYWRRYEEYV